MKKPGPLLWVMAMLILLISSAGFVFLRLAASGFSARATPTRAEMLLADAARSAATPASTKSRKNPFATTPEVLQQGMDHYADHCAQCHGNNGAGQTMLGAGMYPKPPDMRLAATQAKSDGELFSIIENGIRLSGMPAFGGSGSSEDESWKLVAFLRHLPALTLEEETAMQHLNPKGPAEVLEEKEEDDFLKGGGAPAADHK